mgnify:CR=1 FL=1
MSCLHVNIVILFTLPIIRRERFGSCTGVAQWLSATFIFVCLCSHFSAMGKAVTFHNVKTSKIYFFMEHNFLKIWFWMLFILYFSILRCSQHPKSHKHRILETMLTSRLSESWRLLHVFANIFFVVSLSSSIIYYLD